MNIFSFDHCKLVRPFIKSLVPAESNDYYFGNSSVHIRKKKCPQEEMNHKLIIGIASYYNAIDIPNVIGCDQGRSLVFFCWDRTR